VSVAIPCIENSGDFRTSVSSATVNPKFQPISLQIATGSAQGAASRCLPFKINHPPIRTAQHAITLLALATTGLKRNTGRIGQAIAGQRASPVREHKAPTASVAGISFAAHLAADVTQIAPCLITNGAGSEQARENDSYE
jgi:hypothetical protein